MIKCCQSAPQHLPHTLPSEQAYVFQAQQDEKRDGGHSSLNPLLQRHGPITVVVNFFHHFMEDLEKGEGKIFKDLIFFKKNLYTLTDNCLQMVISYCD